MSSATACIEEMSHVTSAATWLSFHKAAIIRISPHFELILTSFANFCGCMSHRYYGSDKISPQKQKDRHINIWKYYLCSKTGTLPLPHLWTHFRKMQHISIQIKSDAWRILPSHLHIFTSFPKWFLLLSSPLLKEIEPYCVENMVIAVVMSPIGLWSPVLKHQCFCHSHAPECKECRFISDQAWLAKFWIYGWRA